MFNFKKGRKKGSESLIVPKIIPPNKPDIIPA